MDDQAHASRIRDAITGLIETLQSAAGDGLTIHLKLKDYMWSDLRPIGWEDQTEVKRITIIR